jgi:hypothetical protein
LQSSINNHQSTIESGLYIPIINQQSPINNRLGGGEDISSFLGEKAWGEKEMFVKYRQNKG